MAKHVQPGEDIRIAPGITGKRENEGELIIIDDWNREQLYPKDNIEHKIRIFERQVNGWFLDQASSLLEEEDEDNGFVILMIATSYIEGIEQYRQGKSSKGQPSKGQPSKSQPSKGQPRKEGSRDFFKEGVKRIFQVDSSNYNKLDGFYSELRCGLFHNGMTGPYIRIHSEINDKPIGFSDGKIIKINQRLFLEKVKEDFEQYLADLKNTKKTELRNNFKKMYTFE